MYIARNQGIVLQMPSVVAIDDNTNSIVAVGEEARKMLGKTPDNIVAIRPLREGVISNFEVTERMIRYFIGKCLLVSIGLNEAKNCCLRA